MHLQAENYTEAACTLLLYWELLQWEDTPLREFLQYPAQSEWQRKEALSRKVIHYFNKGKCWEYGIPLCRELAFQYELLYDYQSLSWIRKMEAGYYDNIVQHQRLEPEFFRVGFYGRKFPFFLRNKEFVCRGHDYERLEAFQQRMLGEFPQAIAMQHPNQPDDTILQCDSQYLQIYAVTPVPEFAEVLHMDRVPDRIKSFYRVNNIRRFRYDRPFHKGPKDRDNEFKSLWIERTTLILSHPLPGISRWFEVERRELVEVSPLQNAVSVVEKKNQELRSLISQYDNRQLHSNINLLSMCLNGVIDAAVNGGVARYQEAFFDKQYISSHPEDAEKITQLRQLMQEQVHVLGVGLAVHEKLVHPEMRPLHKKLIDQFQMMRSSLYHGLPGLDKLSPVCSGASTPHGTHSSHNPMSPESIKLLHRHSPSSLQGSVRHSSSSLSSSSETGNLLMGAEPPEDLYRIQPSPSSSSLSSAHSTPSQLMSSAPSSGRGSPSLPDRYRHTREMLMVLPPHRDRPIGGTYPSVTENGQPASYPRTFPQQLISPCKPCGDTALPLGERAVCSVPSSWSMTLDGGVREPLPLLQTHGAPPVPPRSLPTGHFLMHYDGFQGNDFPPALPVRSLRKSPLHPILASPTSSQSGLDGSNSTLSGSGSSGISSLSESHFAPPTELPGPAPTDALDSAPIPPWAADKEAESAYLHVRYGVSESGRAHSGPAPQEGHLHHHHHAPYYYPPPPPTVPPKPHPREGCALEECVRPAPRSLLIPRKISQQPLLGCKGDPARVAWEHTISEE
ncbi:hypothetical protein SKAU_G00297860 [Synaphobranchus kaupii]|uniref:DOCKER domain-containing protein n=1 Tax=Synaphobranchus kaupii TaxID=118154 RepID=A0A9Q1EV65_SYNKA|nr:hypothetical protein SKAU_G00297860 [Synaphobranchus kaupii]